MKRIFFITHALIFSMLLITSADLLSQTNRYTELNSSTYSTIDYNQYADYYKRVAENKRKSITQAVDKMDMDVQSILKNSSDFDDKFVSDIEEIIPYLNNFKTEYLSMDTAEYYVNRMYKIYNRAVRKYNKRLKKAKKNN